MKYVLLMRHAKSSWSDPSLSDHQRPLKKRGQRDAPRMGRLIAEQGLIPDEILCSTAVRAVETVEGFLSTCPFEGQVQALDRLYHADYLVYLNALRSLPDQAERAMIVGHNPDMNEFLEMMGGFDEHMVTAAVANIAFPIETWADLDEMVEGTVLDFWTPRAL
jgi:phosphohistidine phosphatase